MASTKTPKMRSGLDYGKYPLQPLQSTLPFYLTLVFFTFLTAIAFTRLASGLDPSAPSTFSSDNVRSCFTGLASVDTMLAHIVVFFAAFANWEDVGRTLQFGYLLLFMGPVFLVWFVEGWRVEKRGSLVSRPTNLGVVVNFTTIGTFGPFVCGLDIWSSRNSASTKLERRRGVPKGVARVIGPAVLVGHVLPTILMLVPGLPAVVRNDVIVGWQFTAVLLSILIYLFADTSDEMPNRHSQDYLPHLVRSYKIVFGLATVYHWVAGLMVLFYGAGDRSLSLTRLVLPHVDLPGIDPMSSEATGFVFIKYDAMFAFISVFAYGIYSVYNLRFQGLVTTKQACVACGVYVGSQAMIGPGAALVGLWWWRENHMASEKITDVRN